MLQTVKNILKTGISGFPDNAVFGSILDCIEDLGEIPSVVQLFVKLSALPMSVSDVEPDKQELAVDHRIRHLAVSSFKGFSGDNLYGINCCDSSGKRGVAEVASVVLLGSNGVGKTSLYSAMEIGAMNHSYIADVHGYEAPAKQAEYIRSESDAGREPQVLIAYNNGQIFKYPENTVELCPRAFFCSQYDIQYYESHGMTVDYIMQQLGRLKLYRLLLVLVDLQEIMLKANIAANLRKRLKESTSQTEKITISRQLFSETTDLKKLLGLGKLKIAKYEWVTENILKDFKEVLDLVKSDVNTALAKFSDISRDLFPKLLNNFLKEDNAEIIITEEEQTVLPLIKIAGNDDVVEPRKWFNTFRMKLFILSVKFVLSFTSKIIDKNNYPVVMDDVLDSSDFRNKYEIRRFFNSVVSGHDEYNELIPMPLQIIFFSQDKIIATNVYEGIAESTRYMRVKYCRLFHYKDVDDNRLNKDMDKVRMDLQTEYYNLAGLIERSR